MPNIVEITVRSINGTKPMFDQVRRDSEQLGRDAGTNIADESSRRLREEAQSGSGGFARAGDAIGDSMGRRIAERINERVRNFRDRINGSASDGGSGGSGGRGGPGGTGGTATTRVNVDVDKPSLMQRMLNLGKEAGMRLGGGLQQAFSSTMSGIMSGDFISMILKGVSVAGIATALGPVLGAGITSALGLALGGGVIAGGIAGAFQDPKIKQSAKDFGASMKEEFAKFGEYFKAPVSNFMDRLKQDLMPQVKPLMDELGVAFAPITENLGNGIIGFLQNLLPPLTRFIKESGPLWDTLAESLPKLGEDLGYFFDRLSEGAPEARVFLNDFISALGWIIRRIGDVILWLTDLYIGLRQLFVDTTRFALKAFNTILDAAVMAFGWIPGLGPKLKKAEKDFADFSKNTNKWLDKIEDENVTITITQIIRTIGNLVAGAAIQVGRILNSKKGVGGIIGAASGGIRNGLTWVGENGPELVDAAPGSHVYSNPDSMRMMNSGGGSGGPLVIQLMLDGRVIQEVMVEPTRRFVSQRFGGDVQLAYGS